MFSINDCVIYAAEGVCRIVDIRPMVFDLPRMAASSEEKTYYVLSPVNKSDAFVYVPTDSAALVAKMRRVLTKDAIDAAIDEAKRRPMPDLGDRKRRMVIYKTVCDSMKCELLLLLVRALYERRRHLFAEGKKMSFSDNEMLSRCEMLVANEFAFSLGIEKSAVAGYIKERFEK